MKAEPNKMSGQKKCERVYISWPAKSVSVRFPPSTLGTIIPHISTDPNHQPWPPPHPHGCCALQEARDIGESAYASGGRNNVFKVALTLS